MLDLFSSIESQEQPQPTESTQPTRPQKKKFYKGKKGQFTSQKDAEIYALQAECDKYKTNYHFYKRQANRLSKEVNQEKKRADMLQAKIRELTKSSN